MSEDKYFEDFVALKKEYDEFIYIVSHDLKSPMRAISNITNWIEEDLGDNVDKGILDNFSLLKNRVGRLEKMMNALLELSRVNKLETKGDTITLLEMIKECIAMTEVNTSVKIKLDYNVKELNVTILAKKMQKVFFELLDNAIQFHDKEKKNIFVAVNETERMYEILVQDDGPGIAEEVRDKIFNIFYTVSSKDDLDTTGAGLAISKKIMEMMGGKITYEAVSPMGSIFKISWPKNNQLNLII